MNEFYNTINVTDVAAPACLHQKYCSEEYTAGKLLEIVIL